MPLNPLFVDTCRNHLPNLLQLWVALPAVDLRRVMKPTSRTSWMIEIEHYRGSRSSMPFVQAIPQTASFLELV